MTRFRGRIADLKLQLDVVDRPHDENVRFGSESFELTISPLINCANGSERILIQRLGG